MTNLFGFDISGLPVPAFVMSARVAFVAIVFLGAWIASRAREARTGARVVVAVALLGLTLAWLATMFPLPGVYGTNGSMDRENHLGWTNVVAIGFSPLRTFQVNHLHFEPLWPLLTAAAAGFDIDRVEAVFQWAPLLIGAALILSIRGSWRRGMDDHPLVAIEAGFAALGAVLLIAVPGDADGPFRNPWALTFLLKPNHALGLVLTPLAALAISRAKDWKSRILAGVVLQTIGWAFVLHMALFVAGLIVFVVLSWATRRLERRQDLLDVVVAVGINLLIVSPYLVMLLVGYPFLQGSDAYRLSPFSERPLEGPLRLGVLFLVSAFGAWKTYADRGRLGRLMASQWLTAQIVWQAFPLLGLFGQAREQDEAFYWCRVWTGLFAGVGLLRIVHGAVTRFVGRAGLSRAPFSATAIALVLAAPSLLPAWWDPTVMDQYFRAARSPLPAWIQEPTQFIRTQTPTEAAFAGDRNYARWIAAYGARRALLANSMNNPGDTSRRIDVEKALLEGGPADLIDEGRTRYALQYVIATPRPFESSPETGVDQLKARPYLETVYDGRFEEGRVVIFRILPPGGAR